MSDIGIKRVIIHRLNLKTGEKTEHELTGKELDDWLVEHGYKQAETKNNKEDVT